MSIPKAWSESYPTVPEAFIEELFAQFSEQLEAWYLRDWEKVGLKAGKIAEISLSIIDGRGSQMYGEKPTKPNNFLKTCLACEERFKNLSRPLRIQLPRALAAIYELRNNRSIGHVGGVVDLNAQDGEYLFRASKWAVSELSRAICEEEGQAGSAVFYNIVNRSEIPIVWQVNDTIRVLRPDLPAGDRVIIVLAHSTSPLRVSELQESVEYRNVTDFKRKVLQKLHDRKFCEYNKNDQTVQISPLGMRRARELHN